MKHMLGALLCAGCLSLPVQAETLAEAEQAVAAAMRAQWDTPAQPLQIPLIVVQEDVAIADWLLGDNAGRALLRKQQGSWHTLLCGGSALLFAHRVQRAGVPPSTAEALVQQLRQREQALPLADKQRIDNFQGVMDFTHQPHHDTEQTYAH